jgi:hypothetical protein
MINLRTALQCPEARDRTSLIHISGIRYYELRQLIGVMNNLKPFPILTNLSLENVGIIMPRFRTPIMLPETFLGGSAPSLRSLSLVNIKFPTFPKFILSSTHLVHLSLTDIGYFSPEVMASCLAALPKLNHFHLGSQSPPSTIQQSVPPLTHAILPALTHFSFRGFSKYFEALVAQIDTPVLRRLFITFFVSTFEIPRIHDFVNRIENLGPFSWADMEVSDTDIEMTLGSSTPTRFKLAFGYGAQGRPMSSMSQVFSQQLRLLISHVERLEIRGPPWGIIAPAIDFDSSRWLELFRLFVAVKSLYLSDMLASTVATVLKEIALESTMEVFPALSSFYLEGLQSSGSVPDSIDSFVASRQLSGHPVVIEAWERQLPVFFDDEMDDN